ncbi:response regulator transcription factor [Phenylobacterium sp.]|jgi:DNA-binding NarL/FixJ family response regulator|uniref:response regulator transcription factor n=1 Tax=Phenylobacterium sp. TaxID=1871053 RepID=UPI002F4255DC
MIRVFLVDDQTLVRKGVRGLLSLLPDIEVVGEASDGAEALELIPQAAPDVVLLDIRMPGVDGLSVLRRLGASPTTRFIVLTTFDDADALFEGCRAGARGFLLKDVSLEQLEATIRAVADGRTILQPSITETLLCNLQMGAMAPADDGMDEPLSEREREVIRLMAGGFSNREIGEMLGLSTGTVKNHVSRLLLKLDARDRTSAVLKALASRLA